MRKRKVNQKSSLKELEMISNEMALSVTSTEELAVAIKQYWPKLSVLQDTFFRHESHPELLDVQILSFSYCLNLSNTHSSPKSGVTNWRREKTLPMGYSGWRGRIRFNFSEDLPGFLSDYMSRFNIHLGTGGGSHKDLYYDFCLWADDWPAWKELEEQRIMWKALTKEYHV